MVSPNKSLGQHWLHDEVILKQIVDHADIKSGEQVLEIGPGLGTLTDQLLLTGAKVTAIEFDKTLLGDLHKKYSDQLVSLINEDILKFNFEAISGPYKIVANIPYYLTSNLLRTLSELKNPPTLACLLVQKEVAERIAANPGQMSKLSVFTQNVFETSLGVVVKAAFFTPPPKVDSQVIILRKRVEKIVPNELESTFAQIVKAGFSEKRKKLRSSLSGGLQIPKQQVDSLLHSVGISPDERAQNLSIQNWMNIAIELNKRK